MKITVKTKIQRALLDMKIVFSEKQTVHKQEDWYEVQRRDITGWPYKVKMRKSFNLYYDWLFQ